MIGPSFVARLVVVEDPAFPRELLVCASSAKTKSSALVSMIVVP